MSQVRFISDYHFGHKFVAEKRGFSDPFEMNEHIVQQHNKVVHKRDFTIILGDITMETDKWYFYLDQMKGRKMVILGNHDDPRYVPELLKYVDRVGAMMRYKGVFLTHCPVHPQELEYRVSANIHGHLHEHFVTKTIADKTRDTTGLEKDDRYFNVCCEQVDYKPKTLKELGIIR
jgi:calcineurin-like phosphoesterase family protein